MATVDTDDLISVTEANKLGVSGLLKAVESGHSKVVLRNNRPIAVVVGMDDFQQLQDTSELMEDVALVAARVATSSDRRHSLDEVLDHFGYTREGLLALASE